MNLLPASGLQAQAVKDFPNYDALRRELVRSFALSKERIWITTEYLTDGELAASLFMAKYRNVDVQVLLGIKKLKAYMSRLNYLNKQSIPVFTRPKKFPFAEPTIILTDSKLALISGDLNFLIKDLPYTLTEAGPEEIQRYVGAFLAAAQGRSPIPAQAVPLVGKARHNSKGEAKESLNVYRGEPVTVNAAPASSNGEGFNYDARPAERRAPDGMPTILPKRTLWQEKQLTAPSDGASPQKQDGVENKNDWRK